MACVAGLPMRTTATRWRSRCSRMALVAWVVPSITWVMRWGGISPRPTASAMAEAMPEVTSGVVATLEAASTRSWRSSTTASVWVPPTSIPSRRSTVRGMQALHGHVVEVVAPGAGSDQLQAGRRPPGGVAGEGDHAHPLAVAQALADHRAGAVLVQDGDDVGDRGHDLAVQQGEQVLVLELEPEQPAGVLAEPLDRRAPPGEALGGPALDVGHLALDQPDGAELRRQHRQGVAGLGLKPPAKADGTADRAAHGHGPGPDGGHGEDGQGGAAAHGRAGRPHQSLRPGGVDGGEGGDVAALVGDHDRPDRQPVQG